MENLRKIPFVEVYQSFNIDDDEGVARCVLYVWW